MPEFGRGHFLIARVSHSLASGLQTQLSGTGLSVAPNELLTELAEAGLTLGDEFLRTGRTAEGALGQYLVERLLWQPSGSSSPLPHWTVDTQGAVQSAGFILQIDPFNRALDALSIRADELHPGDPESRLRSDLVSLHIQFCCDELWIRPVVLESKFLKSGQTNTESALAQAAATASQFDHLLEFCVHDATKPHEAYWAQPERLLLAELVHLGLRLSRGSFTGHADAWHKFERAVLSRILSGNFRRDNAQALAIIHHPGPTQNNLVTSQPHALVAFADSKCGALRFRSYRIQVHTANTGRYRAPHLRTTNLCGCASAGSAAGGGGQRCNTSARSNTGTCRACASCANSTSTGISNKCDGECKNDRGFNRNRASSRCV